jgi:hypothetical protein
MQILILHFTLILPLTFPQNSFFSLDANGGGDFFSELYLEMKVLRGEEALSAEKKEAKAFSENIEYQQYSSNISITMYQALATFALVFKQINQHLPRYNACLNVCCQCRILRNCTHVQLVGNSLRHEDTKTRCLVQKIPQPLRVKSMYYTVRNLGICAGGNPPKLALFVSLDPALI